MITLINKKDIIGINKEVGESGALQNPGSLDYSLSISQQKKSWLYELAYLSRSLLVDHAFRDGNKRTSLVVALLFIKDRGLIYDKDKLVKVIWQISKKNVSDINKLARMIKSAIDT
ncbi:MAG: Fic family protein [Nanoarchaeota archaeon]|nr:Fic family protein [Nanoarchaeota archaeon]MBU1005809.1 Fic family protein [Nanoarchaeota archaeon]MBU1945426.1 Fic family protein [Nanoarchaeota archaeon]